MPTLIEAAKKALYNEVRSEVFYRLAAEVANRDDTRVLFMELGDLEGDHARELADRITGLALTPPFDAKAYLDDLEENVAVLVPPEDEQTVRGGNLKAVLKLAKRLEVESRDVYRRLAKYTDEPSVKAFCADLAELEERHFQEIHKLELSLDMAEEARPAL